MHSSQSTCRPMKDILLIIIKAFKPPVAICDSIVYAVDLISLHKQFYWMWTIQPATWHSLIHIKALLLACLYGHNICIVYNCMHGAK